MKWRIIILIGLLCITITGTAWAGWNDYHPATLEDITSKHAKHFSNRKDPQGYGSHQSPYRRGPVSVHGFVSGKNTKY